MAVLRITATCSGAALDPDAAQSLRLHLERTVGAVEVDGRHSPSARGIDPGLAAIAVAVIGSPAVAALVGLLKSWFERDDGREIELEGPGGRIRLKGVDARRLGTEEFAGLIERLLDHQESAGAAGRPDSG